MPKRTKPAPRSKRKFARKVSAPRGPGVIDKIIELISAPKGCTKAEAKPLLAKAFPDRQPDSMANTFSLNMHLYAVRKEKIDGRGLVYYGSKK